MMKKLTGLASCFCLMVSGVLYGQQKTSSTTHFTDPVSIYHLYSGHQSGIYNGTEYIRYPYKINFGHPYFIQDNFSRGNVAYDNIVYENIPLLLDEVRDELITKDFGGSKSVILHKERIDSFEINGHQFIHIKKQNNTTSLAPGFYRILYNGKSKVLVKEVKTIHEKPLQTSEIERSVFTDISYFMQRGKEYYKFSSAGTLLSLFGEHQKAVNKSIRQKRIRFKSDKENFIVQAVTFYDHLNQ